MSSAGGTVGSFKPDSDVHISYEDQQKINRFANLNAKLEDLKDELKIKNNELQNIKDAVEELELADDDTKVPFLMGDIFIHQDMPSTQSLLEETKSQIDASIKDIEKRSAEIVDIMSELKVTLKARFGNHIHLEADED
ncbi:unnamed protein product [Bemisia tabaci]|uniref:Prefoldin subunit 4 n=1 Tax=Bemisia tabaci TaxID=7038 RepID=A0A9P0F180_BEMTA|nr:PREDICTED: probable prefoldin subunit 4 [Bemisia tabaci]CAH0385421.1 unnamed protein product [Bemisia tabaci]